MELLKQYALSFLGVPYRWGGENPITGVDCSGLVQELLISAGAHPDPHHDFTAQALYSYFEKHGAFPGLCTLGALAFYGKSRDQISHVAFCLDSSRVIEAGGGNHLTLTKDDAAAQNAFVRIRPVDHRADLVAVIKPAYNRIGAV